MSVFDQVAGVIQDAGDSAGEAAGDLAETSEDIVDAAVDAATGAGESASEAADETADEAASTALQAIDTAMTIVGGATAAAAAAASSTGSAADAALRKRECAVVTAVGAVFVAVTMVVVAIVLSIFTFGAGAAIPAAAAAAAAVFAASVALVIPVIVSIGAAAAAGAAVAQTAAVAGLRLLSELANASMSADDRRRRSRESLAHLKRAMENLKAVSGQQQPSKTLNPDVTLAAAERLARTLAKLVALLQRRRLTPSFQRLLVRLTVLQQAHANLVAQLKRPVIVPPVSGGTRLGAAGVPTPGLKR